MCGYVCDVRVRRSTFYVRSRDPDKAVIKLSQERYQEQANKHLRPAPQLEEGDKVMINRRNMKTNRPSEKLDHKYVGPYKVRKKINDNAYNIEMPHGNRKHDSFHVALLKKYMEDTFGRKPMP